MNNYVKTQGLVNPVVIDSMDSTSALPSTTFGVSETGGRNYMLVVVFFVAWVLYTIRKMFAPKKQVSNLKDKLIPDDFERAL